MMVNRKLRDTRVGFQTTKESRDLMRERANEDGYTFLGDYLRMLANIGWNEYAKTRPRPNSRAIT